MFYFWINDCYLCQLIIYLINYTLISSEASALPAELNGLWVIGLFPGSSRDGDHAWEFACPREVDPRAAGPKI